MSGDVMGRCRPCEHPHPKTLVMEAWSLAYVDYSTEPDGLEMVLVLHGETGRVPYSLATCPRARGAQQSLALRFGQAGIIREATYERPGPDTDPFDDRFLLPQLVLSQALAEREGRYCVADSLKPKIAAEMQALRNVVPSRRPASHTQHPRTDGT